MASAGQLPLAYTILINVRGADVSDHAERLNDAMRSSAALENYLCDLSGNVGYYLPRDYSTMFAEVVSYKDRPASLIAQYDALSKPKNNGCYVATAVYGSYDCREVWVLRRFRDDNLAVSKAGRLFIACYYQASPTLIRILRPRAFGLLRRALDRWVDWLVAPGYSDLPYGDPP